jgi:hypothetical protein
VRHRLAEVLGLVPASGAALEGIARERFERLVAGGEPWLGAEPGLADLGYWMIEPHHAEDLRRRGCAWLARFPSAETARRLAAVALDAATPEPVRDQAIRALGDRALGARHPATLWPAEAVQLADESLVRIASAAVAAGRIASAELPVALRTVTGDGIAAVFARAPGMWGDALECFASPPLARVLAVSIEDIPPEHRVRVLRLIAATLGDEAVPVLLARLSRVALGDALEIVFLAIAFGGEVHLGRLEDVLRGMNGLEPLRARARWHLQNPGVVPTVRGLRVARTTATIAAAERARSCAQAADDLAALTRFERHAEPYVYALWADMVRGAGDPSRARELVAAHPAAQAGVRELYVEDLARRGRVGQVVTAAHTAGGIDHAALQLAIWGRPIAALELAAAARHHTPELACARALACYRAGRPDLTDRILAEDLPPAELSDDDALRPFPGADEQWRIRTGTARPAVVALAGGRDAIVALAQPAPHDAEPDSPTIEPVLAIEHRLARRLAGATVVIAGELKPARRDVVLAALAAAGARLASGPMPGTDYYVVGDACPAQLIAQLERQGARRLRDVGGS